MTRHSPLTAAAAREIADAKQARLAERRRVAEAKRAEQISRERRIRSRTTSEYKKLLPLLCDAAMDGSTEVEIELPLLSVRVDILHEVANQLVERLLQEGFQARIVEDKSLVVGWRSEDLESADLSREVNAHVLNWVASSSGQLFFAQLWAAVQAQATRGKQVAFLTLEALPINVARWGENQPYRIMVGGTPSGSLVLSLTSLQSVVAARGFRCEWRPNLLRPHPIRICW